MWAGLALPLLTMPVQFWWNTGMQGRYLLQAVIVGGLAWFLARRTGVETQIVAPLPPAGQAADLASAAAGTDQAGAEALFAMAAHPGRTLAAQAANTQPPWLLIWAALTLGVAGCIPFALRGALGSPLDTLLAALLAFGLGALAAVLMELRLFSVLRASISGRTEDFFLAGLGISGILVLLGSGLAFPFGGMQIMLLLALPGFAWAFAGLNLLFPGPTGHAGLRQAGPRLWAWTALLGLAAFGPLAFVDPDELNINLMQSLSELWPVALGAARQSALAALAGGAALGIILLLVANRPHLMGTRKMQFGCLAGLVVGLALAGVCSLSTGVSSASRPDFNGERLFVILKDQADLSQAAGIQDPLERRAFVYRALIEQANASQAGLRQSLDSLGVAYTPYYLVNAIEIEADEPLRAWLALRPEVDRVLDSPRLRPLPASETQPLPRGGGFSPQKPDWNLTQIGADRVWSDFNARGQGVVVGQSDSGVDVSHPAIQERFRGVTQPGLNSWLDAWYGRTKPYDFNGHGTHTTGTMVGKTVGVAPEAEFIACANLARNLANPALYLACWQFMLAPFPAGGDPLVDGQPGQGAMVLNNSWGCPALEGCDVDTFAAAAHALKAAGVFVVVSAGNDGPACGSLFTPPAVYPEVFAVGAVDQGGQLAEFSNIGPTPAGLVKPDILAPGVGVLSSIPGGGYARFSGTSMAGPHVAGVVALMWSANPSLIGNVEATADILRRTARPYRGALPACPGADGMPSTASGYGIVDAYAAVQEALKTR
jgi:hypothetical protein